MKTKMIFSCQACGYQSPKWLGRCPDCSSWNSFVEEPLEDTPLRQSSGRMNILPAVEPVLLKDIKSGENVRLKTNIIELDRVLGGGIVRGGVVLLGGDPGIGKSTISLQISNSLSKSDYKVLYISGEESVQQTRLRAERLGVINSEKIYILNQTDLSAIMEYINNLRPDAVIIDSIQVIFNPDIPSSPGSVGQVRECANILTQKAKASGISMIIIGHVTKEGMLAGPRVLEHIVDTVLYFEGEGHSSYRILRTVKNRFGSTNEIGVFQMGTEGLIQVLNPSEIFLSQRPQEACGSVVTSVIEGTRPLLLEIQALVARSSFGGYPTRRSEGFDHNRLSLLIAVLEKRLGLNLESCDVFINVVGGIEVRDPSCDLAVAVAVASSFKEKIVKRDVAVIGEVGLASEIRAVTQMAVRINEAQRLGFKKCVIPKVGLDNLEKSISRGMELISVRNIQEAIEIIFN